MKNDLTKIERDLLKDINFWNRTKYNYTNLMQWSNSEEEVKKNIRDNEIIYKSLGLFVAINPNPDT